MGTRPKAGAPARIVFSHFVPLRGEKRKGKSKNASTNPLVAKMPKGSSCLMATLEKEKFHYKTTEAAEILNCSLRHVTNLLKAGKLKYWKAGKLNKIPATELERYIKEVYSRATERRERNLCSFRMEDGELCSNYVVNNERCYPHSEEN